MSLLKVTGDRSQEIRKLFPDLRLPLENPAIYDLGLLCLERQKVIAEEQKCRIDGEAICAVKIIEAMPLDANELFIMQALILLDKCDYGVQLACNRLPEHLKDSALKALLPTLFERETDAGLTVAALLSSDEDRDAVLQSAFNTIVFSKPMGNLDEAHKIAPRIKGKDLSDAVYINLLWAYATARRIDKVFSLVIERPHVQTHLVDNLAAYLEDGGEVGEIVRYVSPGTGQRILIKLAEYLATFEKKLLVMQLCDHIEDKKICAAILAIPPPKKKEYKELEGFNPEDFLSDL